MVKMGAFNPLVIGCTTVTSGKNLPTDQVTQLCHHEKIWLRARVAVMKIQLKARVMRMTHNKYTKPLEKD